MPGRPSKKAADVPRSEWQACRLCGSIVWDADTHMRFLHPEYQAPRAEHPGQLTLVPPIEEDTDNAG